MLRESATIRPSQSRPKMLPLVIVKKSYIVFYFGLM